MQSLIKVLFSTWPTLTGLAKKYRTVLLASVSSGYQLNDYAKHLIPEEILHTDTVYLSHDLKV